ncbi:MAG: MTH938/NDUFAF3 family protein [Gammaproteobacteria bacterium]
MQFNQDISNREIQITSYEPGQLVIGENQYDTNTVLFNGQVFSDLLPGSIDAFSIEHLQHLVELKPDVILLGTGENLIFPESRISSYALSKQIGIEVMNSAAASRTYNVLLSESRIVLAAIFIK